MNVLEDDDAIEFQCFVRGFGGLLHEGAEIGLDQSALAEPSDDLLAARPGPQVSNQPIDRVPREEDREREKSQRRRHRDPFDDHTPLSIPGSQRDYKRAGCDRQLQRKASQ